MTEDEKAALEYIFELKLANARLEERARGLEALVEALREQRGLIDPNLLAPGAGGTNGPGFAIVARAALATAEADEPEDTLKPQPAPEPQPQWIPNTAGAPDPLIAVAAPNED